MNLAQQLEEVLRLVEETGDQCIVMSESHEPFVIMNLVQYRRLLKAAANREQLTKLSETELLEKINEDIAEWREARQDDAAEYDLSQFRVGQPPQSGVPLRGRGDSQQPVRAQKTQEYSRAKRESLNVQVPNLPVVDEDVTREYLIEAL